MVRNYVYVSYGISCRIQHLERQNPQKAPRHSVPEIKNANICKTYGREKPKWYEIMSIYVSYGTSCWIQHLERQNPQKAPKRIAFQR